MKLTAPFWYSEYTLPPRCRNWRNVARRSEQEVEIREVTKKEAPLAVQEYPWEHAFGNQTPRVINYRWYQNRLYSDYNQDSAAFMGKAKDVFADKYVKDVIHDSRSQNTVPTYWDLGQWPATLTLYSCDGEVQNREQIDTFFASFIILEGVLWKLAPTPMYQVTELGERGRNRSVNLYVTHHPYGYPLPKNCFYLGQKAEAQRKVREMVKQSKGRLSPEIAMDRARVLIPAAVQGNM